MSTVLQPWVEKMGWKMQSILASGFRGPDTASLPAIKSVNRWLRTISQNNADPSKDYMGVAPLPDMSVLTDELEWLSCHYVHHLADALRVVAIFHPERWARVQAQTYHYFIAEELFHFVPEDDVTFRIRHADKVEHA